MIWFQKEHPGQCSHCVGAERKGEGQLDRKCYTAISVRSRSASRHAAAGNRCDTHERGTAVGTCASEARPSRVVCAWPAPPGRFGVVAVTAVVGIAYLPPIDSLGCRFWHALVDLQAIHSHPSYPGKNTRAHALISAHKKKEAVVDSVTRMSKRRMVYVKGLGLCLGLGGSTRLVLLSRGAKGGLVGKLKFDW